MPHLYSDSTTGVSGKVPLDSSTTRTRFRLSAELTLEAGELRAGLGVKTATRITGGSSRGLLQRYHRFLCAPAARHTNLARPPLRPTGASHHAPERVCSRLQGGSILLDFAQALRRSPRGLAWQVDDKDRRGSCNVARSRLRLPWTVVYVNMLNCSITPLGLFSRRRAAHTSVSLCLPIYYLKADT